MHASLFLTAIALIPFAVAAPRHPSFHSRRDGENTSAPAAPTCDLGNVQQPASVLAPPTGLQLVLVALGKGTQNYTCADPTAAPAAIGALAQLYNASCALAGNPSASTTSLGSIDESASIGEHFFVDNTTPDFDIFGLGNTQLKKVQDASAPKPDSDVKWLRLQAQAQGTTGGVKMIYRLNTVGGVAPATCAGQAAGDVITVDYEAQYWVYA
ncbi:hypothetical protein EJ02DRAFT_186794 [Clathrospora elynae]|uniref:Malate dehydrogenase n=1 Tax=Clathrospora elynae TaxID=706981 RepID=A0A6A5STY0_9PLEO|nr:hypothetical protein EJ02DRAFT_186794 [Clathrospora elynae]